MSIAAPSSLSDAELTSAIAELPPVSSVLQRILNLLRDPDSDLNDLGRLIRAETGLAAQTLRMANSAFYGLTQPVTSIEEAIQRLGFAEINRLVGALASRQLFLRPLAHYGIDAEMLWQHTLAVAVCSETLAGYARTDRSVAYLAGILHPVGLIGLDRAADARGMPVRDPAESFEDWEVRHFGTDNAAVAARVLRHWKFPDTIAATVSGRYLPGAAGDSITSASLLHAASCLAAKVGAGLEMEKALFLPTVDRIAAAGVDWDEFGEAEIESAQNLQRTRALLSLA